ncbi:MAG: zinc-dependent peptidase [Oligoflexia bacterium]|nr:zinc-dependent peptidase [Oligoflexia bacterium]MBF0367656.1 zinc-dependent peptidase [Oligoflexia bacterium]
MSDNLASFIQEVEALIPSMMKERLAFPIAIHFKKMGPLQQSKKGEEILYGYTHYGDGPTKKFIVLNDLFPQEILANKASSPSLSKHGNLYQKAKAVIIHELTHLLMEQLGQLDSHCRNPHDDGDLVKKIQQYRHILNWHKSWPLGVLKAHNKKLATSPDAYEYENFSESFPVMMEYFLLDPVEFKHRRPATYEIMQKILNHDPAVEQCTSEKNSEAEYFVPVNSLETPLGVFQAHARIDPKKIYQVHYMIAGKRGGNPFGHSSFRLVICAPERTTVGPECLKDIQHHLSVEYVGFADSSQNKSKVPTNEAINALLGKLHSGVQIFPFADKIPEYTLATERGLISVPLTLSEDQKRSLIYKMVQDVYDYEGRYNLLRENCAGLANNVIASILPSLKNSTIETPQNVYSKLLKAGLMDDHTLLEEKQNQKKSLVQLSQYYSFPPQSELFKNNLAHLKAIFKDKKFHFPLKSFNDYLQLSTDEKRKLFENTIAQAADGAKEKKLIQYYFQDWQNKAIQLLYYKTLKEKQNILIDYVLMVNKADRHPGEKLSPEKLKRGYDPKFYQALLDLQDFLKKVEAIPITHRYGIPTSEELKKTQEDVVAIFKTADHYKTNFLFITNFLEEKTSNLDEKFDDEQKFFDDLLVL